MKNLKKVVSSILAISIAASAISISTIANAETNSNALDPDLNFVNYIDFEKWETDPDLNNDCKGIKESGETSDMYKNNIGTFQVVNGTGAENSKGFTMTEKLGPKETPIWSAVRFGDDAADGGLSEDHFNFSQMGQLGASEYVFYIDLTDYKKYKLIKDEETEDVLGREDVAKTTSYTPFVGVWDLGTSVGEARSAYVPKSDEYAYIQTNDGKGGNDWTEVLIKSEGYLTIPKNYKGYVRLPRTSMTTIWGANGDVISDDETKDIGDHLFNGPFEYLTFNGNCGGLEYENAVKKFDNFGFLAYDFDENLNAVPATDVFKEVVESSEEPTTTVTSEEETTTVTSEEPTTVTSEDKTSEEETSNVDDSKTLKRLNLIDFENSIKNTPWTVETTGLSKLDSAIDDFLETGAGAYIVKDGVGANGSAGLVIENYLGNREDDQYKVQAGWSVLTFVPTYADPTNSTGFTPDLFSAAEIGKASEFYFWIDTSEYTKHKLEKDDDENVIGREEQAKLGNFEHWVGIWDKGTLAGESTTCYAVEKGKSVLIQDGSNWVEFEQTKGGNNLSVPKGYVGYVRIPRTSMEGIWGAYGDIRQDEVDKYTENGVALAPRGDGFFNGPIEKISFNGNVGGYELEGAKFTIDDIGFIGEQANFLDGATLLDMPSTGEELPSVEPSTDNTNDNNDKDYKDDTSTPKTSAPNTGSTGVGGAVSAVAIATLACAAAVCFKKKNR